MELVRRKSVYYVRWSDNFGRRQWKSTGTSDRPAAEEFMRHFTPQLRPLREVPHGAAAILSIDVASTQYLAWSQVNHAKLTVEKNKLVLKHFAKFAGAGTPLGRVTPRTLEQYKMQRSADGMKATTVNLEFRTIKAFLRWCVRMELISRDPTVGVKQLRIRESRKRAMTHQEYERLWNAASDGLEKAFIMLAVCTGMRRSEITSLTWDDVDIPGKALTIRAENAKSGKSRTIPLSPDAEKILFAWKLQKLHPVFVFAIDSGKYQGNKLSKWHANKLIRRVADSAGLPWVTPHTFRHTFVTWGLDNGGNIVDIQHIAGHSSITVTAGYAHSTMEGMRKSISKISV